MSAKLYLYSAAVCGAVTEQTDWDYSLLLLYTTTWFQHLPIQNIYLVKLDEK